MAFQRRKSEAIGVKAPFPKFIAPALASPIDKVPSGTRWIHEIKFDGYRVQVHLANEAMHVFSLEGVVSKVRDSAYPTGARSHDWLKKTCAQRETLTIAGFALDGKEWYGIYVGRRRGDDLVYASKVDHGFDKASIADLRAA